MCGFSDDDDGEKCIGVCLQERPTSHLPADFADFKLGGPPRETPRTLGLADILDAADRELRRRYVYLPPPAGT